jgi:uncharacterized phage protein (TIGR02218 family)
MATLDTIEKSIESSRPVELYTFIQGTRIFLQTSAESTVTFNGSDYEPLGGLKRSGTTESREQKTTAVSVTLPTDSDIARPFISIQPSEEMTVEIQRVQPDSVPVTSIIVFEGYVSSVAFKDEIATFRCIPFNELFGRQIPRFQYQGLCNHVLYDARCKIAAGAFKSSGTVLGVNGREIQIQNLPTAGLPFIGGFLRIPGTNEQRLILDQVSTTVTVLMSFAVDISGGTIDAFQGCDHTAETCARKFDNIINYGGFPFVPIINPFEQTQITKE